MKKWMLVLPTHKIKINFMYLTQQIAAERCSISSKMTNEVDQSDWMFHQAVRALPDDKTILRPKWNWPKKMKNWRRKEKKKNGRDAQTHKGTSAKGFRGLDKDLKRTVGGFDRHSFKWRHSPGQLLSQTALHSDAVEKAGRQTGNLKQSFYTHTQTLPPHQLQY